MEFNNLRIKNINSVLFYTPDIKHFSAKNRRDHIVGIQLSGSALHTFEGGGIMLSENGVFFLNQKDDYDVTVYETGDSLSVHFTTYEPVATDSFCVTATNTGQIISDLKSVKRSFEIGNVLSALSFLYKFCNTVKQINEKSYFPKQKRILDAKQYIDTHYTEKGCYTSVLEKIDLSARRFSELFGTAFGMTPNKYISFRRIDYAKTLLETNMLSVNAISEKCGFSDVYYFSKVFKKETGISPGKWSDKNR